MTCYEQFQPFWEAMEIFTKNTAAAAKDLLANPTPHVKCDTPFVYGDSTLFKESCATGMLVQILLEPSLCSNHAYICKAFGIPKTQDFISTYENVKNTRAGDEEQARLFLSRDVFEETSDSVKPVLFALHHRIFWNPKVMSVFLDIANEVRLLLKAGSVWDRRITKGLIGRSQKPDHPRVAKTFKWASGKISNPVKRPGL